MVDWDYFDKYNEIINEYMPAVGEGKSIASQIVTAVNKIIFKYYNDGDVFDNTKCLEGWCNNLSTFANWLDKYTNAGDILEDVWECTTESEYEDLLQELADYLLDEEILAEKAEIPACDSIYTCTGRFRFVEREE